MTERDDAGVQQHQSVYTPGVVARVVRMATTHTAPMPAEFRSEYEWAAAWVRDHGVTLPPDTTELRKLRNWFCYKVDCYRKGTLNESVQNTLALHGIDLSQYRALNTGKGEREDDEPYVLELLARMERSGTYDLDAAASPGLRNWQKRLLDQFSASGRSARATTIEARVPGLNLGRWRKPTDSRTHEDGWWATAAEFRASAAHTPAFRGALHPSTPEPLLRWAQQQQRKAAGPRGTLTSGQRGELIDLGILGSPAQRAVQKIRMRAKEDLGVATRGAPVDKQLDTFLGAACLVRMLAFNRPFLHLCTELAVLPADLERLLQAIAPQRSALLDFGHSRVTKLLPICRQLDAIQPGIFTAEVLANMSFDERPAALTQPVLALGQLVAQIRDVGQRLNLPQDVN